VKTREQFYGPGLPANPGQAYGALVRFAKRYAGASIWTSAVVLARTAVLYRRTVSTVLVATSIWITCRKAKASGLAVANVDSVLPFADKSFDTVLILEVLEHVIDVERVLREAFRVARKKRFNHSAEFRRNRGHEANDVTYAHMLSSDHLHFFEPESLEGLLRQYSKNVSIERADPIYPFWFLSRSVPFYALKILFRLGLMKPRFFSRLYAVASVREN
jgi:SAM-dependent methyltransferase